VNDTTILFFTEGLNYLIRDKKKLRKWLYASIVLEKRNIGSISFIICPDTYLHELNLKYLNHDTYTDIITFDYSDDTRLLSGDIFISLDRVKENAKHYHVSFVKELHRVMIHGLLHLAGYKDKTSEEKMAMRAKEDYYLSLQPEFFKN